MQIKIQISRHFKIKFRPLAELDPTRPALSCKFSDPIRPAGRVKSRAILAYSAPPNPVAGLRGLTSNGRGEVEGKEGRGGTLDPHKFTMLETD